MLQIRIPSRVARGLAIHHNWFATKPTLADAFQFAQYYHCRYLGPAFGLRRRPKFTLLIDLTLPEDTILKGFSENTRYKVGRAAREGVRVEMETDIERYCAFAHVSSSGLMQYWPDLRVTKAMIGDKTLVMHSYLFDQQIGRVALYHSISSYQLETDSAKRNFIGRANRWLHFQDMLLFKRQDATIYDFGGIASGTDNVKLRHIDEFKRGFGGSIVEESNYVSTLVIWWNRIVRGREVTT
jgi:hypothetical protein